MLAVPGAALVPFGVQSLRRFARHQVKADINNHTAFTIACYPIGQQRRRLFADGVAIDADGR